MRTAILVNQSTGYLTVDICNAFAKQYDRVILLAGRVSSYPRTLNPDIEVFPICPYDKSSIAKRIATWIKGARAIKKFLRSFNGEADVLYFTNPPLSYFWADKINYRFGIVEYDIYPDALKNVRCPKIVIRWWSKRNKKIFDKAAGIITLSGGMKQLLTKYVSAGKIKVIPNWSAEEKTERVPDDENPFVKLHNLQDKFVVMYSGNIGYTHNIETIINVAEDMRNDNRIVFLIIGDGGKKESLYHMAKEKNLINVVFSDFLPADELKYSMSCANLGVVTLTKETAKVSVPSKTYNLLSYGIPLLSISPSDSELGRIIKENNCGRSFEPQCVKDIAGFIDECISNHYKYQEYRENALNAAKLYTKDNAVEYTKIFE